MINILKCNTCNIHYVRETALPSHKRIDIHRTAKSGFEYMVKHFQNDCAGFSFSIKILEIFESHGNVNGKVCSKCVHGKKRLETENH